MLHSAVNFRKKIMWWLRPTSISGYSMRKINFSFLALCLWQAFRSITIVLSKHFKSPPNFNPLTQSSLNGRDNRNVPHTSSVTSLKKVCDTISNYQPPRRVSEVSVSFPHPSVKAIFAKGPFLHENASIIMYRIRKTPFSIEKYWLHGA